MIVFKAIAITTSEVDQGLHDLKKPCAPYLAHNFLVTEGNTLNTKTHSSK